MLAARYVTARQDVEHSPIHEATGAKMADDDGMDSTRSPSRAPPDTEPATTASPTGDDRDESPRAGDEM